MLLNELFILNMSKDCKENFKIFKILIKGLLMLIKKMKIKLLILINSKNIWHKKTEMDISLEIKSIFKLLNLKFLMLKDIFI